jgi:hypothetical protein
MNSYKVTRGFVKYDGVLHARDSIFNADAEQVIDLISTGKLVLAEVTDSAGSLSSKESGNPSKGLKKLKGGFYELPNGKKVRGLEAAVQALADLQASSKDDPGKDDPGKDDPGKDDPDADGKGPNTDLPI